MRSGRFSLRIKLFMLAGLPLVAMIGVSALAVQQALTDRDRAEAQLIQVDGATILADLAQAVRNERVITTSSMASVVLPNTRGNTDSTFDAASGEPGAVRCDEGDGVSCLRGRSWLPRNTGFGL